MDTPRWMIDIYADEAFWLYGWEAEEGECEADNSGG
jgi:hypothetical protein